MKTYEQLKVAVTDAHNAVANARNGLRTAAQRMDDACGAHSRATRELADFAASVAVNAMGRSSEPNGDPQVKP